jgi:hypothetical protein
MCRVFCFLASQHDQGVLSESANKLMIEIDEQLILQIYNNARLYKWHQPFRSVAYRSVMPSNRTPNRSLRTPTSKKNQARSKPADIFAPGQSSPWQNHAFCKSWRYSVEQNRSFSRTRDKSRNRNRRRNSHSYRISFVCMTIADHRGPPSTSGLRP